MGIAPPVIEVFADLWCPFTHVGLRAVVEERGRLGRPDAILRVRPWPLELVNDAPMRFATTVAHAQDLRAQVAPGLFAGLTEAAWPGTTLPALALVEAAYRHNPRLGEEVSLGLRDALFEEGCDLADPAELAGFAEHVGVPEVTEADHRAVLASLEEGRARGVKGSPHFFCGGADSFCPTLDIGRDEAGELRIGLQTTALRTFLEDSLT